MLLRKNIKLYVAKIINDMSLCTARGFELPWRMSSVKIMDWGVFCCGNNIFRFLGNVASNVQPAGSANTGQIHWYMVGVIHCRTKLCKECPEYYLTETKMVNLKQQNTLINLR